MGLAESRRVPGGCCAAGFTLIEMIVVLAVIGLVLALVLPNLGHSSGRYALAATAHDVAATLRIARDRAIARNRPTRFVANASSFGSAEDHHLRQVPPGITLSIVGREQTVTRDRASGIRFFPDGSSTGGRIDLKAGTARYAVLVDWLNGDVSIEAQPAAPQR